MFEKIKIGDKEYHTTNSEGQRIHSTDDGIKNFHKWFGDSNFVDEHGRPQVMYHGSTHGKFDSFDNKSFRTSYGHFFTPDKKTAEIYTGGKANGHIHSVYLKSTKNLNLDHISQGEIATPKWMHSWAKDEIDDGENDIHQKMHDYISSGDLYSHNVGRTQRSLLQTADMKRHDSVSFHDNGAISHVVFDPKNIKSIENVGSFKRHSENLFERFQKIKH